MGWSSYCFWFLSWWTYFNHFDKRASRQTCCRNFLCFYLDLSVPGGRAYWAARLVFRKPRMCAWSVCGLAVVFVFLDRGLFLRALTKTDKTWNCHKIIPQWVNMSVICTGDFIFWLSDVFLEFASIPFQFISSHKSEPCIPFPASLTLHFRLFWPLSL